jgi:tRNA (mo5U34)-methyltransferase
MVGVAAYEALFEQLATGPLGAWVEPLQTLTRARIDHAKHGDLSQWRTALEALPEVAANTVKLNQPVVSSLPDAIDPKQAEKTRELLQQLHPWRKGPFELNGVNIDTEWRSDWKWKRLEDHIQNLAGRTVLDVGCGNGYHCWRMAGAGARLVVGIDPTLVYLMQFLACRRFLADDRVWVLPLALEDLPDAIPAFDSVFSMGVLYHRKSPINHLLDLHALLRPGGELILETLVVEGDQNTALVPRGRYARMRNVWFIPSTKMLELWLQRCRFSDIKLVDVSTTSADEQRSTEWMHFESLSACLDPKDASRTIEGDPAPLRAILTARK